MREITTYEVNQINGGDVGVSVSANVLTADEAVFAQLLANFLTGQAADAASIAAYITANAANFNDMTLHNITVGNFVITPTT